MCGLSRINARGPDGFLACRLSRAALASFAQSWHGWSKQDQIREALMSWAKVAAVASGCLVWGSIAWAQAPAEFYRGRTITLIVTSTPGGDYDNRARLVARHMERHIDGQPKIVVQNMPGGGGLRGINHIYRIAPRDGTVIGAIDQQAPLAQAFGERGVEYDLLKSSYLGNTTSSPIVLVSWHKSSVKTFRDALEKELVIGATGAGSASVQVPLMINALIGSKFRVVSGYPGGNEIYMAMENGEVEGRATQNWSGWKSQKPDWLRDKKINLLAQAGARKHPELPDVPLLADFARSGEDRQILEIYFATAIRPGIYGLALIRQRTGRRPAQSLRRDNERQ